MVPRIMTLTPPLLTKPRYLRFYDGRKQLCDIVKTIRLDTVAANLYYAWPTVFATVPL